MITGAELVAGALVKLEIDASDATRWDVYGALNEAQIELVSILPVELLPCMTVKADLSAAVALYQYPDNFVQRPDGMIYAKLYSAEARIIPITKAVNRLSFDRQPSQTYPVLWMHAERGYEVMPTPAALVTDGQELTYVYRLPTISAQQDSLFDQTLKSLLIYRATMSAAMNEAKKLDVAKVCSDMYQRELAKFMGAR